MGEEKQMRRACIYFIYDKDGVVDDYILDQLRDLRENADHIHCVINGSLTSSGRSALAKIADEVYVRENKGNDIGAYKAAIEYIGWRDLEEYDELILMNNTCFGPVYPFKECFEWASALDVDFWALSCDTKSDFLGTKKYLHYNKRKTHYQSFFLVFRKPLLGSKFLMDFFAEIPDDLDYVHSGCLYEYAFPGYFEEHGYKGAAYCECDDYHYPLLHDPVRLLREFRMPLFKKRSFFHHYTDALNYTAGEATVRLIKFLEEETDYDMSLVWKPILRTSSLSDVVRCAQLNRVLPRDFYAFPQQNRTLKVGAVYHVYYEDLIEEDLSYLCGFDKDTDILIVTDTEEKSELLSRKAREFGLTVRIVIAENRGRDVSSLLVAAADFVKKHDLICFAHDKKSPQMKPESIGRSWAYKLHENVMGSREYIANVIGLFERERRLGIAFPSPPNHDGYALSIGTGWFGNYSNTKKLMEDLGINVKTNEHTLCVAPLGTCFWFRRAALKKLFSGFSGKGWSYSDFPREPNRYDQTILHAIERTYAYAAQDAGYYPAYIYSDKFAAIELTNLEFNKTGSTEMRAWCDALAMGAIGINRTESYSGKSIDQISSQEMVAYYDQNVNYGIKRSLVHLAYALRCKFPRLWGLLLPFRRVGQWLLGIKTK